MKEKLNLDLSNLIHLRKGTTSNPMIGYLNINSLKNKTEALREIRKKVQIDILCIDETNFDCYFPDSLFKIDGYQYSLFKRNRYNRRGGKMVCVREALSSR